MSEFLATLPGWLLPAGAGVLVLIVLMSAGMVRYIPNNSIAIVEKLWSFRGSVQGGFIALRGEAGYQPQVLRGVWVTMMAEPS